MKILFLISLLFVNTIFSSFYSKGLTKNESNFEQRWKFAYFKNINELLKKNVIKKDKQSLLMLKNMQSLEEEWSDSMSLRNLFIKDVITPNQYFEKQKVLILESYSRGEKNNFNFKVINLSLNGSIYCYVFKNGSWDMKYKKDTNTIYIIKMFTNTVVSKPSSHIYTSNNSIFLTMINNGLISCNVIPAFSDEHFFLWKEIN